MVLLGHPITSFPLILVISLVAALLGTFLTPPDKEDVLKEFLPSGAALGFLGADPRKGHAGRSRLSANKDFFRDMFNIVVGTIWQTCFIVLAMFLVTRHFRNMLSSHSSCWSLPLSS